MADPIVLAKARAAEKWVSYANEHAKSTGATPWTYALIPHNEVTPSATLAGLVARNARTAIAGPICARRVIDDTSSSADCLGCFDWMSMAQGKARSQGKF